ncbi:hypothetical protein [Amycolatopsis alkalitolerans]|uniref:DUF320 domain-containing protein n=1 Tax=Amycolatopsis alkalitolerans TaxID=2547244 RepID=A0A5C4M4P7_9PSEU|nr:hypothetical protein [Amycolatopsis alkalitolerans]TNC27232.1 hypothetical protein FG385_09060 [Amycolatopsis alkalitolerans]
MQGRTRKAAAVGAAAFVLAGSALLATPGTASAATITAKCGDTVTAHPGDTIQSPLGLTTVTDGLTSLVGGLLSGLCKITVNVVDTVVAPVPVVGPPVAGAVDSTVSGATNTVSGAVGTAGKALTGGSQPAQQNPPSDGSSQSGPSGGSNGNQSTGLASMIPGSSSPVLGGGDPAMFTMLPFGASGYAPMRDYSGIPYALAGLFAPSPGVRYGGQIPGYAPEVGSLGDGSSQQSRPVQNAGQAQALPADHGPVPGGSTLPMLIAVLALSGVSAALVRTWVLRPTATR